MGKESGATCSVQTASVRGGTWRDISETKDYPIPDQDRSFARGQIAPAVKRGEGKFEVGAQEDRSLSRPGGSVKKDVRRLHAMGASCAGTGESTWIVPDTDRVSDQGEVMRSAESAARGLRGVPGGSLDRSIPLAA